MQTVDPMLPIQYRIKSKTLENQDTFTFELLPLDPEGNFRFLPGQFNMLYLFGMGEVAISISGDSEKALPIVHTIRAVGTVTKAMQNLQAGDVIGVRGPFGSSWPIETAKGKDVLVIVGGIGLAPLRPVLYYLMAHREDYGQVSLLYGARTPEDQIFMSEYSEWSKKLAVYTTVDRVDKTKNNWQGQVGVVTNLIAKAKFDANNSIAMICGPEIMMRFVGLKLKDLGMNLENIFISMERNMKCAIGFCGHCQLAGTFICKNGPVYTYQEMQKYLELREV
ncbi:MAG: FAD/NAD(P)-binding protein [Blastocatellia bacterium]